MIINYKKENKIYRIVGNKHQATLWVITKDNNKTKARIINKCNNQDIQNNITKCKEYLSEILNIKQEELLEYKIINYHIL